MRFFEAVVARPVLVAALNLLLVALGLAAALSLPIREYPDVDPPTVSIRTAYVGAAADVVEREITKVVEENLSGIDGVRQIQSRSRDGSSAIDIQFVSGTDLDAAAADVRDKVSAVRRELPDDVEEPAIEKASADDQPMMWITLRSDELPTTQLTDLADRLLTDALGVVPGVARIQVGGEKRYAMRIWLDARAMAARGVTAGDVAARLRVENVEVPAGRLETGLQELSVRTDTRLSRPADFAALVLRDVGGERVLLGDVAQVEVGVEEYRSGLRANGRDAVSLGVIRQSRANTLEVAAGVQRELERLGDELPGGVELRVDYDESVFIRETLRNVATTLALTIAIIVLVIYVFLGSLRATVIPAVAIPASVLPVFAVAAALGFSINVLSILAVILAIGLCVDDVVVIMENVRRRQAAGEPVLLAAVRASRQVGFAVLASSAVLVAAILPLAFLGGNVGRLFREFAVVLTGIVVASTFAAVTLGPMLAARLFREGDRPNRVTGRIDALLARAGGAYRRALEAGLAHAWVPFAAAGLFLALGVLAFLRVPTELAPPEDRGALRIVVEGPEGASAEYMRDQIRRIERIVAGYMPAAGEDADSQQAKPVRGLLAIVSPGFGGASNASQAFVIVRLQPWDERDVSQQELQQRLQRELAAVPGVRAFASGGSSLGQRRRGQQLQFVVGGIDRADVRGWAATVLEGASGIEGLQNADLDYHDTRPQVRVAVDRARAAALGVDAATLGETLQIMLGSLELTRYVDRGEEYEVILQAAAEDRREPADIGGLYVRTRGGQLVPLSSVVQLDERGSVRELTRVDRLAAITLEASLAPGLSLGDALGELERIAEERLPSGARINYLGESLDYRETGASIYLIAALVLVLAYLVLAGQFESFADPAVVLLAAPLAVAGGLVTIWALGLSLNVYTQIALVLLVGLVAKNAILIVEFANQLRQEGREPRAAVLEAAAQRLRPIVMTSLAVILGAMPLVLDAGAGSEARRALGIVTAGGVTFGTLLTLFVVPIGYALLAPHVRARGAVAAEVARQEREAAGST